MRRNASLVLALVLTAAWAPPHIYVGIQGMVAGGAHTDVAGKQSGIAGGALLQFGVRGKRVLLHAEGIPPISLPQAPSAYYGQATPQLSLINGAAQFSVDPARRWWIGAGMTVINQRTPLPRLGQLVTSRLAGTRYEVSYRLRVNEWRFLEMDVGGAPHLTGADHYMYAAPAAEIDKPEIAAEQDAMLAYGVRRGTTEWLVGLRSIAFSARYAANGSAADRNNGAGALLEWRHYVR